MPVQISISQKFTQMLVRTALVATILALCSQNALAASCQVVHHPPPTEADQARLTANYTKAEKLYRTALAANPVDRQFTEGLVRTLLLDQKVQEAADAVQTALAAQPKSPAFIELRAEVEFRQGEPWTAGQSVRESMELDPCNPRTHLLWSELLDADSFYASARKSLLIAHQLDSEDPDIRSDWMVTLPLKQRIAEIESYLSAPTGDDAESLRHWHEYLDLLKKRASDPPKPCRLASQVKEAQLPFTTMRSPLTDGVAFGLPVKLNNRNSTLEIDTGAGGILVSDSVAKHAGLKPFSQVGVGGVGDDGDKKGYTAYADSIQIGNMEFQNCMVTVVTGRTLPLSIDGLIGTDVFSSFLVTLDYPGLKLLLSPLPLRPGEDASAALKLNMEEEDEDSSGPTDEKTKESADGAKPDSAPKTASPQTHGPFDRYIAPEMADYTPVYRTGQYLIVPTGLNYSKIKLFILDTGAWETIISPQAAREVTNVHDAYLDVEGVNGKVDKVYGADKITFRFGNLAQKAEGVVAIDTSKTSKDAGMEISGFLGATTLGKLTVHIDYRDGLVKFDYDPKRKIPF